MATPTFVPTIALAAFDFSSPWATLTWLKPSSLAQLSLIRLFGSFMGGFLAIRHINYQAIPEMQVGTESHGGIPCEEKFQVTYFSPFLTPAFRPISALAAFEFRLPWAPWTWLKPNSLPQLSLIRLFVDFIEASFGGFAAQMSTKNFS